MTCVNIRYSHCDRFFIAIYQLLFGTFINILQYYTQSMANLKMSHIYNFPNTFDNANSQVFYFLTCSGKKQVFFILYRRIRAFQVFQQISRKQLLITGI